MTILLAEDSAVYRHLITSHLNEWGFDFVCAKDGQHGGCRGRAHFELRIAVTSGGSGAVSSKA